MQNQDQNKLYTKLHDVVPKNVLSTKNKARTWQYGYNEKYDIVVISKSGQIQDVININGLRIALPKPPAKIYHKSKNKIDQYSEELKSVVVNEYWKAYERKRAYYFIAV